MTKEDDKNNINEDTDESNTSEKKQISKSEEKNTKNNNKKYNDTQVLGGIIFALIVLMGGVVIFGGGAGTVGDFDYPAWADEDGIVINDETGEPEIQLAIQSHTDTLSAESYTLNIDGENSMDAGETEESSLEYKYNPDSQTAHGVQIMNNEQMETYDEFGEERQLIAQGTENMTYDREPLLQPIPFTAANEFVELMSIVNTEAVDTDGDVVIYEIDGVDEQFSAELDVEASGEIHLHQNGYFTYMDITVDDNEQGVTTNQEVSVTEIGSTDVEEPAWYNDALEQTEELTDEDFEEAQQPPEGAIPDEEIPEEEIPEGDGEDEPIVIE